MPRHPTFLATELLDINPSDSNLTCLRPSCHEILEPTTRFEAHFVLWQITCLVQRPEEFLRSREDAAFGSDREDGVCDALLLDCLRGMLERLAKKMRCSRCLRERGDTLIDGDDEGMVERWFELLKGYLVAAADGSVEGSAHLGIDQATRHRSSTSPLDSFAVQHPSHTAREAESIMRSASPRLLQNSLVVPTGLECLSPPLQNSSTLSSTLYTRPATPYHPVSSILRRPLPFRLRPETTTTTTTTAHSPPPPPRSPLQHQRPLPFRLRPETTTTAAQLSSPSSSQYAVQEPPNLLQNNASFSTERKERQSIGEIHVPTTETTPRLMSPIDIADVTVYGDRVYVRRSGWVGSMDRDRDRIGEVGRWSGDLGAASSASAVSNKTTFAGPALNVLNTPYEVSPPQSLPQSQSASASPFPVKYTNNHPEQLPARSESMMTRNGVDEDREVEDEEDEDEDGDDVERPMTPKTWVITRIIEILREE